ncbi:tyrosine-type recombinase/integrase [Microtetraspora sp. AC03309]|uniref:tyrosine-type recombinase/integrase n=1 Tax=Microtetraspora sp. AC03309 TaxID=2779376 RepID=UPI0035AFF621
MSGPNWNHTWKAATAKANKKIAKANKGLPPDQQRVPVPGYTPHDCRHTAASRLVQAGVPLYDVKALLRHSSIQTTRRYAHPAPDAHDAVESGWSKIIAHQERTTPGRRSGDGG